MNAIMVDETSIRRFVRGLLVRHGADAGEAEVTADALIWSDMRGQESHGLSRLPAIVERIVRGGIVSPCPAEFRPLSGVAEALDGHGGFGQYLGALAARRAAVLARREGVGVVAVRDSNHFGAAGYYACLAAAEGMAALVTSNSFPTVAAPGGRRAVLGTNPLAFAAPRAGDEPLVIDMGTTFRSRIATVINADRTGTVEKGMAVDERGESVSDTRKLRDATLLPPEPRAFALGLIVEVISGVLTGAGYSRLLHSFYRDPEQPGNLGHFILCLHPERFMDGKTFRDRMEHLIELLMTSGDMSGESRVRMPGEERWRVLGRHRAAGSVPLGEEAAAALEPLARRVDLAAPWRQVAFRRQPVSAMFAQESVRIAPSDRRNELMHFIPDSADLLPGPGFRIRSEFQRTDADLLPQLASFDTPTISDALNRLYALDSGIQCLTDADRMCGFVCTVHVYPGDNLLVHKALDIAEPGDIVMINAHGGGGACINAVLGDMICTKARHRGIAGFIVDGLIRDLPGILETGLPVFARGTTAIGPLHRGPGELNYPIACGGVVVNPGDVAVADRAGLVVVPKQFVRELVGRLEQRTERSRAYKEAVTRGEFSNSWVDAVLHQSGCLLDDAPCPDAQWAAQ